MPIARGESRIPPSGTPTYNFAKFPKKLHEIDNILGLDWEVAGAGGTPFRSATDYYIVINWQWRIQDFPQGGAPTPKNAIIFQFFAENCMKMKEFGPPGGARVPGAPPWIRQ